MKARRENPISDSNSWTSITYSKVLSEHRKDEKIEKLVSDWLGRTNKQNLSIF